MIATVAVDNTFFSFDTDYSYRIPDELAEVVRKGTAVHVPFGRGDQLRRGIVIDVAEGDDEALKSIASADSVALSEEMTELAKWLKERCFCTT